MSAFLKSGVVVGVLTLISAVFAALGKPAAAAFVSDPSTASAVQHLVDGVMSLVAGGLTGVAVVKSA